MKKHLLAVGLILDFASPHTLPVLNQSFGNAKVIVYPLRAKSSAGAESSCKHVLHQTIEGGALKSWSSAQTTNNAAQVPLAEAINKLEFDLQFKLYPCYQAVIVTAGKDSCGEDACKALRRLETTLRARQQVLRLQVIGPLECNLKKNSPLLVEHISGDAITRIAKSTASPLPKTLQAQLARPAQTLAATTLPNHSINNNPGAIKKANASVQIGGPPVELQLTWAGDPTAVPSPSTFHQKVPAFFGLPPGKWKIALTNPSWIKNTKPIERDFENASENRLSVIDLFADQLAWVDSSRDEDQVLIVKTSDHSFRILVPQNSPPVPLPSNTNWKLVSSRPR